MSVSGNRIRLMSFVSHYFSILKSLRLPAVILVLLVCGAYGILYYYLPKPSQTNDLVTVAEAPNWPTLPAKIELNWDQFSGSGESSKLGQPDFAKDFRFAGTFFLFGSNGEEIRKAVLSLASEGRQVIASEGDVIAGVTVLKIFEDRVILKLANETTELRLSFSSVASEVDEVHEKPEKADPIERFGKSVAKNSWILRRESLLDYYYELLEEPERLLNVFDSLKPLYGEGNRINGYTLGVEGESEFFNAVGLKEGDIIKKVNSLKMTSRNRAEFFIKQVVQKKLSAIVIDIERDGQPKRLVYRVR